MIAPDFALHITWTCYGNWLPGDARGYVSNTFRPQTGYEPKQNIPQTPYTASEPETWNRSREIQKGETVRLTIELARCAAEALVEAASKRGWWIERAALMANHVHVVIWDCPPDGPAVRRVLKGTSQAALSRLIGKPQRWWTAGGSDRYKNDAAAVAAAVGYAARQKDILVEIVRMEVRIPHPSPPGSTRRRVENEHHEPPG